MAMNLSLLLFTCKLAQSAHALDGGVRGGARPANTASNAEHEEARGLQQHGEIDQHAGPPALPPGLLQTDKFPLPNAADYKAMADANIILDPQFITPVAPLNETFHLHSLPGGTQILFIDFDGRRGGYKPFSIDADRETFNDEERLVIQQTWASVAEDFLPFTIDVTTEDPGDSGWIGQVAVIDGTSRHGYSWAYSGSWGEQPTDVAHIEPGDNTWLWIADSVVHEIGHTLGLGHDGNSNTNDDYYRGHGSGETEWCPSMGWGAWSLNVWSDGNYCHATNQQDDLAKITSRAGINYRPDDHGNDANAATDITAQLTSTFALWTEGTIGRNGNGPNNHDVDYFKFTLQKRSAVQISINRDVIIGASNLDAFFILYDDSLMKIFDSLDYDPGNTKIGAEFDDMLEAGTYYFSIEGNGWGNPGVNNCPPEGYSNYGLMGYYSIQGAVALASCTDDECNDLLFCNGQETCNAVTGICVQPSGPCGLGQACTEVLGCFDTVSPTGLPTTSPSSPSPTGSQPQPCTGGGNNAVCTPAGQNVATDVCCSGYCKPNGRCSNN